MILPGLFALAGRHSFAFLRRQKPANPAPLPEWFRDTPERESNFQMKSLMIAAAAALFTVGAASAETVEDLRQPAIDKCTASTGTGEEAAQAATMCTCLVDGLIAALPGEDGVKMLKLVIADPKSPEEAGAALGIPAEEAQAFVTSHTAKVGEVANSCMQAAQ